MPELWIDVLQKVKVQQHDHGNAPEAVSLTIYDRLEASTPSQYMVTGYDRD